MILDRLAGSRAPVGAVPIMLSLAQRARRTRRIFQALAPPEVRCMQAYAGPDLAATSRRICFEYLAVMQHMPRATETWDQVSTVNSIEDVIGSVGSATRWCRPCIQECRRLAACSFQRAS
jgi:hypothetical protein